jgi:hypothetical protein
MLSLYQRIKIRFVEMSVSIVVAATITWPAMFLAAHED